METKRIKHLWAARAAAGLAIAAVGLITGPAARAQTHDGSYPNHAIRMIVPGAAGGASDTIGRLMADQLAKILKRSVIVENHPGAGTIMASQALASSPPDGYTIQLLTNSFVINTAVRKSLPYDPAKDVTPVILLCSQPNLMAVKKNLPVSTLREFVALAKKEPGKRTFGSAGTGSASALAGELFKSVTGTNLLHVPYKGGTPALVDLLAGRVDALFFPVIDLASYSKAGKIKALAITSEQRSPLLPKVPTNAQAGVQGIEAGAWYGIALPGKTPQRIVAVLNQALNRALKDPEVRKRMASIGSEPIGGSAESFARHIQDDLKRWKKLVALRPELRVQ